MVRKYNTDDISTMIEIWNEVVNDGLAFPQEDELNFQTGKAFFDAQTSCGIYENDGKIQGLYILHPNNVGRCGHIANASYAVSRNLRNQGIGEKLVLDSLREAKKKGFRLMQFNAVVKSNSNARHLYERLGFIPLGVIPGGFKLKDGSYEDICPYYYDLTGIED